MSAPPIAWATSLGHASKAQPAHPGEQHRIPGVPPTSTVFPCRLLRGDVGWVGGCVTWYFRVSVRGRFWKGGQSFTQWGGEGGVLTPTPPLVLSFGQRQRRRRKMLPEMVLRQRGWSKYFVGRKAQKNLPQSLKKGEGSQTGAVK